jgi:hypothetical protein
MEGRSRPFELCANRLAVAIVTVQRRTECPIRSAAASATSAFLKERGAVKVLVLVVRAADCYKGARGLRVAGGSGLLCSAPGFVDRGEGRLGCRAFLR